MDHLMGVQWTTLHDLEVSIGHPFDGPGRLLIHNPPHSKGGLSIQLGCVGLQIKGVYIKSLASPEVLH